MDLIGSAGLTRRIINNSTFPPFPATFYTAHLSCLHKGMTIINQDFDHLMFKSEAFVESQPIQTVNICKCLKQDARVETGAALLPPPNPRLSSRVSLLEQDGCVTDHLRWRASVFLPGGPAPSH